MNAVLEIKIYGAGKHLATLKKHDEVPIGLYSDKPLRSHIHITPSVVAHIDLQIENIAVDDDYCYHLVSNKNVQIGDLLSTLGIDNFTNFINDCECHGWTVEKYIDGINKYFQLNADSEPFEASTILSENLLNIFLFVVLATTPALIFEVSNYIEIKTPFTAFIVFLSATIVIFHAVFGVIRHMNDYRTVRA